MAWRINEETETSCLRQRDLRHRKIQPSHLLSRRDWRRLRLWYRTHGRGLLPWRLKPTPWSVLLAETLLHRTRADIVAKMYPVTLQEFPSVRHVVANKSSWIKVARKLGLSWRAKDFIAACKVLADK